MRARNVAFIKIILAVNDSQLGVFSASKTIFIMENDAFAVKIEFQALGYD